jgi:hypothetical protein
MLRSLFVGFGVDVGITPGRCSAQGRACASERRHQVVAFVVCVFALSYQMFTSD